MGKNVMIEELFRGFRAESDAEAAIAAQVSQFVASHGTAAIGREVVGDWGHLTAAAWITNPECSQVLLVFGAREGVWKLPGAHCENSNPAALRETAARESNRALGQPTSALIAATDAPFALAEQEIPAYWNTPIHLHFELIFRFTASVNPDSSALPRGARWFDLETAAQLNRETIARCIRKTRSDLEEI